MQVKTPITWKTCYIFPKPVSRSIYVLSLKNNTFRQKSLHISVYLPFITFLEFPSEWSDMQGLSLRKVELPSHTSEFQKVKGKFMATISDDNCLVIKVSLENFQDKQTFIDFFRAVDRPLWRLTTNVICEITNVICEVLKHNESVVSAQEAFQY